MTAPFLSQARSTQHTSRVANRSNGTSAPTYSSPLATRMRLSDDVNKARWLLEMIWGIDPRIAHREEALQELQGLFRARLDEPVTDEVPGR